MTATPAIDGWFTTDPEPALTADRCTSCGTVFFPPTAAAAGFCRNPACDGETFEQTPLARRGRIWSYTDAQYRPPAPYIPATDPYEPFALAAVELPEGLVVLGQVAAGFGVADLRVGDEAELVVETLYTEQGEDGAATARTIWRWRPVAAAAGAGTGEQA